MRVLLSGASGFVGRHLLRRLETDGHEVIGISRRPGSGGCDWSADSLERAFEGADAVVHLAGESLFGRRWTRLQKRRLVTSRVDTAKRLAELTARHGLATLVTASAVGYYGASEERGLEENRAAGDDFLARLCDDWEAATTVAAGGGARTAIARIGVVLGRGGGALERMVPPFRLGLGGPLGSGRQWVSWIHLEDLVGLLCFLLESEEAAGPFNATAPQPCTMKDFARALGEVLHRPSWLPVPGFALRLALGEAADVLLTGQHVVPAKALAAGFEFSFPSIGPALADLLRP